MTNENEELRQAVARLNQRLRNLELLALGILVGICVYVTRAAESWFDFNVNQAILFGVAFSACLLLLFWRQHISVFLAKLGMRQSLANMVLGGVSVLGLAYMVPALIIVVRYNMDGIRQSLPILW